MKTRRRKKTAPVKEELFTVVEIEDFETVCQVCEAEFLDEEDLKLHVAQVHLNESNGKTICKVCCSVLPAADLFVSHFIFKHLENALFCFYCYRVFFDPLLLDQHELRHRAVDDDDAVTCSQCSSILANRQELQKHEYKEHGDSDDGMMLNKFFSQLSSALNIKIKKFIDCLCKRKLFVCRKCKHSSTHIKDFIEHLKALKCRSFACDKCCNVYKKKYSIMNHMLSKPQCHNFAIEKEIKKACPKCDKYFSWKEIGTHRKTCNVIKCFTCKKLFNSIDELTDHQNKEHKAKINLETCKFCKKQFVGMLTLKKHMSRSHKDRNQYKYHCVHCGSMFNHPSKLFAHFFTQHKEIEPYTCNICNKCFRLRKHFTIHIKLQHKSVGFVEFDKNLHVIFTDKKSVNPIEPQANVNMDSTTDASDSDCNYVSRENSNLKTSGQQECEEKSNSTNLENNILDNSQSTTSFDKNTDLDDRNNSEACSESARPIVHVEIERLDKRRKQRIGRPPNKKIETANSAEEPSDSSDEEPLSSVRESLLRRKTPNMSNLKRRMAIRDKRAKLTCKICNKYCYTVQNFHHHMTLHEKTKMKRCIKCNKYFKSRKELKDHIDSSHSSSKLIETLRSVMEKRKKFEPVKRGEPFKTVLEKRRKQQSMTAHNSDSNKFQRTIRKVNFVDDCTATITPMSDHGLSVKNFIENFKPEGDGVNISNSVTIKTVTTPVDKEPIIKMYTFKPEPPQKTQDKLRFPVKFKDSPVTHMDTKVSVKLVQQLITKPSVVNMTYCERIPAIQGNSEPDDYCNMFADEMDYTQYKNDAIPEVAQEVMLEDLEDIPRTRRLAQEIIIPKIPDEHGGVRIGHLLPQAPYYKIVKVKKLLKAANEKEEAQEIPDQDVKLPDGTRLISVKNPYSHLIPNEHLEEILKANRTKNYTPKAKNIEKAIAKALNQVKPLRGRRGRKRNKKDP